MKILSLILSVLILSLNAKAIAVASDYLEDNTLELIEGSSKIYSIRLQNTEPYESMVKIDYDTRYIKAINFKDQYNLPPQSSTRIEFNVTAPRYDNKSNLFVVGYTVSEVESSGSGLSLRLKISKNFNLKVNEIPNPTKNKISMNYVYLVYAAIILFLLYILKEKYKQYKSKSIKFKPKGSRHKKPGYKTKRRK